MSVRRSAVAALGFALAAVFVLAWAPAASAAIWHVSDLIGNDALGDGSYGAPFATIGHALAHASAGGPPAAARALERVRRRPISSASSRSVSLGLPGEKR